jgi:hypothetical protein
MRRRLGLTTEALSYLLYSHEQNENRLAKIRVRSFNRILANLDFEGSELILSLLLDILRG